MKITVDILKETGEAKVKNNDTYFFDNDIEENVFLYRTAEKAIRKDYLSWIADYAREHGKGKAMRLFGSKDVQEAL